MAGHPVKSAKPKFDVLGLGVIAVDDLLFAESYPPPDDKTRVLRTERQCGGLTGIALIAASRLGAKCAYAGVMGRDEFSRFALGQLKSEGINLKYLCRRGGARPVHSYIVVDCAKRTRNIFCDAAGAVGADPNWPSESVIRSARVLFVDHFGIPGMVRAARIARRAGIPVVADLEKNVGEGFSALLGLVDHLIISRTFAALLTVERNPARAAKKLWTSRRSVVVVTCGEQGSWHLSAENPGKPVHHRAFRVNVVDTTGCGDVFHGAYATALAEGKPLETRIRFAAAAAALKATKPGAQTSIPSRQLVEKFLARNGK
jgi:sugar/nucleoside kinase (ribokinase family)